MIKKFYSDIDVVTAARQRIKNIFSNGVPVYFSVSGGKDSIVLNDLIFKMCQSGEIDKSLLTVDFIDEEAIYPCVENVVKNIRLQWLSLGVTFRWWCIECKHFNCFNMLTNDETFICWDRYKRDVWVREKPKWAISSHPLMEDREMTYQNFMERVNKNGISLIGLRVAESIQRAYSIATIKRFNRKMYPIYDWSDKDVWLYILNNNLEIPKAYEYLYRVGTSRKNMRISQFFSVDTAKSLVQMCEYYPQLFERICRREPNAYMSMLYFDTEMFRRTKRQGRKNKDTTDYKAKLMALLNDDKFFTTETAIKNRKKIKKLLLHRSKFIDNYVYKQFYLALLGGDPKGRTIRATYVKISENKG